MKYNELDEIEFAKQIANKQLTPIEMYIDILENQLESIPNDSSVYKTIKACKELAESVDQYYKHKNK